MKKKEGIKGRKKEKSVVWYGKGYFYRIGIKELRIAKKIYKDRKNITLKKKLQSAEISGLDEIFHSDTTFFIAALDGSYFTLSKI